jgi:hypothetical protein
MRQSRDTLCLALKTRAAIGITRNVIGKDFNRDRAIDDHRQELAATDVVGAAA